MESRTVFVVAAALIDREHRVLVQQRPPGKALAGLWEFPGGKVEADEVPEAALLRELREELGIEVDRQALAPATFASAPLGDRHLVMLLYLCRRWTGAPVAHAASELRWYRPVDLNALPMPPADRPLLGLLQALI